MAFEAIPGPVAEKSPTLPMPGQCIAVVGSRRTTLYGQSVAKKLGADLARLGFCVVSGLARGIDTAAHEGALSVGGRRLAPKLAGGSGAG